MLDHSVLVARAFDEHSADAFAVGGRLAVAGALAPAVFWPLEFANPLLVAERRGQLTEAEPSRIRVHVLGLCIEVVPDHPERVATEVLAFARQHGLSADEASSLDPAMRESIPLTTVDDRLIEAARRAGVSLGEAEPRKSRTASFDVL